jgi:hypothetical protein
MSVFWVEISHEWFSCPGNPRDRRLSRFPKPSKPWVIFSLKKHTSAIFCLSHATIKSILRHILARIVANLIQKFKTQSSTLTSRWDYATGAMTLRRHERWRHLGLSLGTQQYAWHHCDSTMSITCDTTVWYGKYHTVGLHAWQQLKFGRNVRVKLFSRVWNWLQWCVNW